MATTMDQNNFVAPYGNGYVVFYNGSPISDAYGDTIVYANQEEAERVFNDWVGLSNVSGKDDAEDTDSKKLDEEKREFDIDNTYRYDALNKETAYNYDKLKQDAADNYANQGLTAASVASGLAGKPEDWVSYANYTNGVKNIFDTIKGDKTAPAFGVSGYSQQKTLQSLMRDLGLA